MSVRFEMVLNEFDEVEYIMDKKLCEDKDFAEFMDFVEELAKENEQLKKQLSKYYKPKISIFNKDKGDWKWNDNNDIILNIRNGKSFYLRNSGAVENLVALLNGQQELIEEKSNAITLMGAFIKSKGFSVDDFDEWISKDWHNANESYGE